MAAFATLALLGAADPASASLPSGFRDDAFLTTVGQPTAFAFAPGGEVFVAEKTGRIVVYDDLEGDDKRLFADLRKPVYDYGDRGLLSLALDPDFPAQPYVYALYTFDHVLGEDDPGEFPHWGQGPGYVGDPCPLPAGADADACPVAGRLVRLTAALTPSGYAAVEAAGEATQQVLVEGWCQQFSSHSIGDLQFAADGSLYVSAGEGANYNVPDYGQFGWPQENQCGDPPGGVGVELEPPGAEGGALRSQDLLTPATPGDPTGLSGAVIRVDPETGAGLPGNPLFGSLDANERRIVAFGFRNPFRIEIDDAHDDLYVANVGWGTYEEIDRLPLPSPSGKPPNSGWPCIEGPGWRTAYESVGLGLCEALYADPAATISPFFFYKHGTSVLPGDGCRTANGSALGAMEVYRGGAFPAPYDDALFFGDTVRGCIYVMYPGEDGRPEPNSTELFLGEGENFPAIDLATGPEGNLFYLSFDAEDGEGSLHRVSYDPDAPIARIAADPEWGPVDPDPLAIQFDAGGSADPGGAQLHYDWDLDGNGSFETDSGTSPLAGKTYSQSKNVKVSVRVDNGTKASIAQVTVYPGDTPPQPVIISPAAGHAWWVGEQIEFDGYADDPEEEHGGIAASGLRWRTRLFHCPIACHAHPLQTFPGVPDGEFVAPDHDYPARIELSLTATDSRGLSATTAMQLLPRTVDLEILSAPPGLPLTAGPRSAIAPFTLRAIEGSSIVLSAPQTALIDGIASPWLSWSNGENRVHTVIAAESGAYTATYLEPPDEPPTQPPPPDTTLTKKPPKRSSSRTAKFVFAADQAGVSFRCKLDLKPYRPCRSPRVYRHLAGGRHVLRVQATAADGTVESQPALYRWRVEPAG